MKKFTSLLCIGFVALAAVSCHKDPAPAPPMSPAEQQQKLCDAAVTSLQEIDPDNWRSFAETVLGISVSLQRVEPGNTGELADLMESWFLSVQKGDHLETSIYTFQLSKLKGELTVKNSVYVYTASDKPLTFVYDYKGKTYKASFEATEGDPTIYEIGRSENTVESYKEVEVYRAVIPTHAAVHVTENAVAFIDLTLDPTVKDLNKDGVLDMADEVQLNALLSIPGYRLSVSQLDITSREASTHLELFHGKKSVVAAQLRGTLSLRQVVNESLSAPLSEAAFTTVNGEIRHLSGEVILKGDVDNEKAAIIQTYNLSTEGEAKKAAALLEQAIHAELYYDNNPTLQARYCVIVSYDAESGTWYLEHGIHFFDGSQDMPLEDFFNAQDFKPLMNQINSFTGKLTLYFYPYYSH